MNLLTVSLLGFAACAVTVHASQLRIFADGTGLIVNSLIVSPAANQELIFDQSEGTVSNTQPYQFSSLFLDAAPGALRFNYSAAAGNPNPNLFASIFAGGEFAASNNDTVAISGAPSSGFLSLQVKMEGSVALNASPNPQSPTADSKLLLDLTVGSAGAVLSIQDETGNGALSDDIARIVTVLLPYANSSITLGESLVAFYNCFGARLESCTASASFGGTFQLGGAVVLDGNQQVVGGARITSQTGYDYTQPLALGTSTPEPSTWLFLLSGLAAYSFFFVHGRLKFENHC